VKLKKKQFNHTTLHSVNASLSQLNQIPTSRLEFLVMYDVGCIARFQLHGISKNNLINCVNGIIFMHMVKIV